jgi:hypothetical protein
VDYNVDWSIYDLPSVQPLIDELPSYYAVVPGEKLIGFCCIGEAARVPGLSEDPATLVVGLGMDQNSSDAGTERHSVAQCSATRPSVILTVRCARLSRAGTSAAFV